MYFCRTLGLLLKHGREGIDQRVAYHRSRGSREMHVGPSAKTWARGYRSTSCLPSVEGRKGNDIFLEFLVIGSLLVAILCQRRYGRERVIFLAYYGAALGLGLLSVVLCQRLSGSSNVSREVQGSMCTVSPPPLQKKVGKKIT